MARYTGPKVKLCRRENINLFGPKKYDLEKRAYPPGQHGKRRSKFSDYGVQLREKQKMKRIYGMLERQFRIFFARAQQMKGNTGENLIQLLERRLDNVIYRALFVRTRMEARQFVSHGHVWVNDQKVNIPSFQVKTGDKVRVADKEVTKKRVKENFEFFKDRGAPDWLALDKEKVEVEVKRVPTKAEAALPVEESMIVELYSK